MDTITTATAIALNFDATGGPAGSAAPEWVQLTPGATVEGRDGRNWIVPDPQSLVERFRESGLQLPIDVNHSTQERGAKGDAAPAMGWITDMEVRAGGAIWGKVNWTDEGARLVAQQSYKYLSPAFAFERETNEVLLMVSAGLTNTPNLKLAALNSQRQEDEAMKPEDIEKLRAELSLGEDADTVQIMTAVNALKTQVAAAPDPATFVPIETHQLAVNRATTAEAELQAERQQKADSEIGQLIDTAITEGRIAPANKEHFVALCKTEEGLASVKAMLPSMPVIAGKSGLDGSDPPQPGVGAHGLNDDELAVCRMQGVSPADFAKMKKEQAEKDAA